MPRKRSLRNVLTAWNALLLAGMLGVFGLAIVLSNQGRLRQGIDDDLLRQGTAMDRGGPPPPPPDEMFDFGGQDHRHGGPPPGDHGPDPNGPPGPNPYDISNRIADVRRPRFFNASGGPLHDRDNPVPFDPGALRNALAGKSGFVTTSLEGEPIRVYSRPLRRNGKIDGAAQFARELSDLDLLWEAQLRTLLVVLPLAVLAAACAAYWVTGRTLRPVARLTHTAGNIGRSGDLSQRLEVNGEDEIAELARTFNDMLTRLERSFKELEQAFERLGLAYEQQKRFAADASHELRTPLTRLRLATSAALSGNGNPDDMRHALATADRAAEAMTKLVSELLALARADSGQLGLEMHKLDLRVAVAEGLDFVGSDREVGTEFADHPIEICGDASHLRRVVVNLVQNALRHTPPNGMVTVGCTMSGDEAVFFVRDTGEGIAPEHLPHLGERFYRIDAARNRKDGGSGLGLAITKSIVEAHGGRLEFESHLGRGTTVRAFFPTFSENSSGKAAAK